MTSREADRERLWRLLGDLPDRNAPIQCRMEDEVQADSFVLQKLTLNLNGVESVPAFFVRSRRASGRAPVVVYNHSHGGNYAVGKEELLRPAAYFQPVPYADALAEAGYHCLAIDSWNFGERRGRTESALFKEMLWKGQVLWGMMVFDTIRATDYLLSRPDVDSARIASLGKSMGSTMAWWHAALDERVKVCVDICCLTDFQSLIETRGLDGHGLYYYVPSLLKSFSTASINALIAPRAHLSLAGEYDPLTPAKGLDTVDAALKKVYAGEDASGNWKLLHYPCGHVETAAMRRAVMDWLAEKL